MQCHTSYKYWAFISYSHVDKAWGNWLHRRLETHRVPKKLRDNHHSIPQRLIPIFRDREELPTSADLGTSLIDALDQSRTLVVICSPHAAKSHWVNEEIIYFKKTGGSDRIFCLIVSGEPNATEKGNPELECFPPAIRFAVNSAGELTGTRVEPIAADARSGNDARKDCLLKLIAGILGVGFDELKQRELQRQLRRWISVTVSAVILAAIAVTLTIVAVAARNEAKRQKVIADNNFQESQRQERIAVQERDRAERNFREARNAVDRFFTRVSEEELLNVEGLQPVRKRLLEDALQYYQKFSRQKTDDPEVQVELAQALSRAGDITTLIGRKKAGLRAYDQAIEIMERVLPGVSERERVMIEIALDDEQLDSLGEAEAIAGRGISLGVALAPSKPMNEVSEEQGVLIIGLRPSGLAETAGLKSGDILIALNGQRVNTPADVQSFMKGLQSDSDLAIEVVRNQQLQMKRLFSEILDATGTAYWGLGDAERALENLERALDVLRQLSEQFPEDLALQQDYKDALLNIPAFQRGVGRLEAARVTYDQLWHVFQAEAQETVEPLGWIWEPNAQKNGEIVIQGVVSGSTVDQAGVRVGDRVLEIGGSRLLAHAANPASDQSLHEGKAVIDARSLANDLDLQPDDSVAVTVLREKDRIELQMTARPSANFQAAVIAHNAGVLELHHLANLEAARHWFERSLQIANRLVLTYQAYTPHEVDLLNQTKHFLAGVHLELGSVALQTMPVTSASLSNADQSLRDARALLKPLVQNNPDVVAYLQMLAIVEANYASLLIYRGDESQAIEIQKESIDTLRRLVDLNPEATVFRFNLSKALLNYGHAVLEDDEKVNHYQDSLALCDQLLEYDSPVDVQFHKVSILRALASTQISMGDRLKALEYYQAAFDQVQQVSLNTKDIEAKKETIQDEIAERIRSLNSKQSQ